ncbi:MAG: D-glycero-beta-D-manno-heptose-7-phosphate kinase [Alphaproteobacteria bacterium]
MTFSSHPTGEVETLRGVTVLCVGDVMLDRYVYGTVDRVSPEAPIPVLRVERETTMLGGAGNVVRNLAAMGARPRLVAAIGDDEMGSAVERLLRTDTHEHATLVRAPGRRTTLKTRFITTGQQLLRADEEDTQALAKPHSTEVAKAAAAATLASKAVVLSDYGKGLLTGEVTGAVMEAAKSGSIPVVVDPKGNDYRCYRGADLLSPNRKELHEATRMPVGGDEQIIAAARHVIESCGVGGVLVTRGGEGMTLVPSTGGATHFSALAREVYDVSGAGDTVVAFLAAALGAGLPVESAARLANVAAGIVVGKAGTAVVRPDELSAALDGDADSKRLSREALLDRVSYWRGRGLAIGFTNGCFDLLHPGHVALLEQAHRTCDRLIVALNSDSSVRRLKGRGRPVQDADARARVLASLAHVDAIVVYDEDTPLELIEAVGPDVLVKGADWRYEDVVGADYVTAHGGRVLLVDLEPGYSTSTTITRLG